VPKAATQWRRGQSGNPKGRPRLNKPKTAIELRELRQLAREYGASAITALAGMAGLVTGVKPAHNEAARIVAIRELLDRGYGRPAQMITGDSNSPLIVDFKWADSSPIVPVPARSIPLTIDAAAVVTDTEAADIATEAPSVSWAARTRGEA
jgi:hypothetical protein